MCSFRKLFRSFNFVYKWIKSIRYSLLLKETPACRRTPLFLANLMKHTRRLPCARHYRQAMLWWLCIWHVAYCLPVRNTNALRVRVWPCVLKLAGCICCCVYFKPLYFVRICAHAKFCAASYWYLPCVRAPRPRMPLSLWFANFSSK